MRRLILVLILTLMAKPLSAEVNADLTGSLQLKGKAKSSDSFLELLKCGLEAIPKKFLRKETISATYTGATTVTLESEVQGGEKWNNISYLLLWHHIYLPYF